MVDYGGVKNVWLIFRFDATQEANTCFVLEAGVRALPSSRTNPSFLKTSICIAPAFA